MARYKVILAILTAVVLSVPAASAQVSVGIENTRLVYGKYTYKDHYSAKLNVSVYSEKIQFQYLRGTLGYDTQVKNCHLGAEVFFGSPRCLWLRLPILKPGGEHSWFSDC